MTEQEQDLLAFLRDLQFIIERHAAGFYTVGERVVCYVGQSFTRAVIDVAHQGECAALAEAIERLEAKQTPQRETPDEDGASYL